MEVWERYLEYVEKHFRFMPCVQHAIGSVPISWDDQGQTIKFVAVNMST